jgi:hypothetical protein
MELIEAINWIIANHYNGNTRTNILVLDTKICFWNTSILESIETIYRFITVDYIGTNRHNLFEPDIIKCCYNLSNKN